MKNPVLLITIALVKLACSQKGLLPSITIKNEVINPVNHHLFGQFMEKCSWGGEIGGDLVINRGTGTYDARVLDMLKSMNIPIISYPGGTDVDYYRGPI